MYGLAFATYAIAFVHFMSELFVFRTIKLNAAVVSPMIVSSKRIIANTRGTVSDKCILPAASMIWMANQANFYL